MKCTEAPVIVEESFTVSKEVLWQYITELHHMKQWFFEAIPDFRAEEGFRTKFIIQVEDRIYPHLWRIDKVIPLQNITYDWSYENYEGRSFVSFEIFEMDSKTKLKVTTKVVEDFSSKIPEFKRESCFEGWNYFIKNRLKSYIRNSK